MSLIVGLSVSVRPAAVVLFDGQYDHSNDYFYYDDDYYDTYRLVSIIFYYNVSKCSCAYLVPQRPAVEDQQN